MQQKQVKNITQHCYNFPSMKKPIVMRDNIIDTIDRLFNSTTVVYIEGEENVGKTIIAAQFAEKHQNNSFCLFIKGSNNIGSNIPIIRTDLYSQINYYLINAIPEKEMIISPDGYIEILYKLTRHCRMQDSDVYFVIDGIDNVEDFVTQKTIMDLFPIGNSDRFKFLIVTGNQQIMNLHHTITLKNESCAKNVIVSNFTEGEAIKLFEEYELLCPDDVITIFKNFKKPGELATIYRLLEKSEDPKRILDDPIENLGDLFLKTWSNNDIDKDSEIILAALAFDKDFHSPDYIATLCNVPIDVVKRTIERITFLDFNKYDQQISFISEGFHKYAIKRLEAYQMIIYEYSLRLLLYTPDDMKTVQLAPFYYKKLGQHDKLSEYLTADRLMSVFKGTKSESQTISIIKEGFRAACSVRHDQNAFTMSLIESISNIFTSSAVSEKEIQARAMLGDFAMAMKVARQAKTKEDKLLLLSQLMMWQTKKGLAPDELTIEEIKILHHSIDYSIIKEKSIRISTYLLHTLPDLAVDIIERLGNATEGESSTDVAIARITMSGIVSEHSNEIDLLDVDNSLIKNSIVKNVYSELRALLKHQPVDKVLNEIDNMNSKSSKLLFLRNWLIIHREEDIEGFATRKAMELSVETLGYTLTASILRDISSSLPYINKAADKASNIEWFDRQISALTLIDISLTS
ncbi:MAG: hypothetical protein SCM11_13625 [Bacillota bacterium]|nr:hypothetical protein [Bacillota bacterium]